MSHYDSHATAAQTKKTLPVCQWQLPVQDRLLYQVGYLETDLQSDSGTRVHLHQSSENQRGKTHRLKHILFIRASYKTISNTCRSKEILENIKDHLWQPSRC